jgi:hypothetical protein
MVKYFWIETGVLLAGTSTPIDFFSFMLSFLKQNKSSYLLMAIVPEKNLYLFENIKKKHV